MKTSDFAQALADWGVSVTDASVGGKPMLCFEVYREGELLRTFLVDPGHQLSLETRVAVCEALNLPIDHVPMTVTDIIDSA